jgi:hypothetical protein
LPLALWLMIVPPVALAQTTGTFVATGSMITPRYAPHSHVASRWHGFDHWGNSERLARHIPSYKCRTV